MRAWERRLRSAAAAIVLGAVFPSRTRPDRWRDKRGFAAHIAIRTAITFALLELAARSRPRWEAARSLARARAGREPTHEEVVAAHEELYPFER